jgi:hypothetical protein
MGSPYTSSRLPTLMGELEVTIMIRRHGKVLGLVYPL